MLVQINSAKCIGINAVKVTVEVDISRGIGIHLVGLADAAVKESLLRTITALETMGFKIPGMKIVINLAPADLKKNGSGYDLPIAIGIIAASNQRNLPLLSRYMVMGELGLDGSVRSIPGALPFAEFAHNQGFEGIILPEKSAMEAIDIEGKIYGVETLLDAVRILEGDENCKMLEVHSGSKFRLPTISFNNEENADEEKNPGGDIVDFADIIGQEGAKRGIEIAAAGGHNIIMIGAPGSGKSSLAKTLPGILPPMSPEEMLVTNKIYSVAGKGTMARKRRAERPFRSPHYSASMAAIIGGGAGGNIIPGEVSLADNGVLFLDEFAQMPRSIIEALRGPIEDRKVCVSRLQMKLEFPASFMLVAATNPCPCGYYGEPDGRCTCSATQRTAYLSRLSGPIMDRIDIQLWMHPVPPGKIRDVKSRKTSVENSAKVAARVLAARKRQSERFFGETINTNAEMGARQIERYCSLNKECVETLDKLLSSMNLSMRAYFRIIKVARTIADLEGSPQIERAHIIEAASFRLLDSNQI